MNSSMKKISAIFILITFFTAGTAFAVWTEPVSAPTGNNTLPPINESSDAQSKSGGLSLGALISETFIKLGATSATCDGSVAGTVRFNNGVIEVCTSEVLSSQVVSVDPGIPVSCNNDEIIFYNTVLADWECGVVPEEISTCSQGEGVVYNGSTWTCSAIVNKFVDGTNPADAAYTAGKVGINNGDPKASLHVGYSADVTLSSTNHAATFGADNGLNVAIDGNEIIARNNGSVSDLHLQADGGQVSIHNAAAASSKIHIAEDGRVIIGGEYTSDTTGKLIINNTTASGPASWRTSIKFTNGSHNSIWNPTGGLYFGLHSDGYFYYGDESGGTHEGYPMVINSNTGDAAITGPLYLSGPATDEYLRISAGRNILGVGDQRLYGDNSSAFYLDSNHSTLSQMIFRDTSDVIKGRVYGSSAGTTPTFGFLDGDGNWTMESLKDTFIRFRVNNSIKMTVESTGDVGIGVTNPTHRLHVENNTTGYMARFLQTKTAVPSDMLYLQINRASPDTGQGFLRFEDSGGVAHGYITGNNGAGVNFTAVSDRRLKTNIETLDYDLTKKLVLDSRPVNFSWKSSGIRDMGYIAQELKEVVPIAVSGKEGETEILANDEGEDEEVTKYMTVATDVLIPVLHSSVVGGASVIEKLEVELDSKMSKRKYLEKKLSSQQEKIDLLLTKLKN